MADTIRAAVAVQRELIEGVEVRDRLGDLIARFATANLYRRADVVIDRLRTDVLRVVAKDFLPYAEKVGKASAKPILDAMGGKALTEAGSALRGPVLREFQRYSKGNLLSFRAALDKEAQGLSGEIEAAFARAYRDKVARSQLIGDLVAADRAELEAIAKARVRMDEAAERIADAEKRLGRDSRRGLKDARADLAKGRKDYRQAKAAATHPRTFFARFEKAVQGHNRDAIRRECQRAQFSAFQQATATVTFVWVTVNGSDSCPSCIDRHGMELTEAKWRQEGMPGDGHTYCLESCMCQLVPAGYAVGNSKLAEPVRA